MNQNPRSIMTSDRLQIDIELSIVIKVNQHFCLGKICIKVLSKFCGFFGCHVPCFPFLSKFLFHPVVIYETSLEIKIIIRHLKNILRVL